jgi:hypothetical protein
MPPIPCASLCRKASPRSCCSSPEVGSTNRQDNAAPSLHPHYRGFIATTGGSAPRSSIGILPHGVSHLSFPYASGSRFSRSVPKPVLRSCRLYTGCHRVRMQVSPRLILKRMAYLSFDSALGITMRLRTVCFRSSSQYIPAIPQGMTFPGRSPPRLLNAAAPGGLKPTPTSRLREAYSHLQYSTTGLPPVFVTHATRCSSWAGASQDPAPRPGSWSTAAP